MGWKGGWLAPTGLVVPSHYEGGSFCNYRFRDIWGWEGGWLAPTRLVVPGHYGGVSFGGSRFGGQGGSLFFYPTLINYFAIWIDGG